jgi:hypothetical protein
MVSTSAYLASPVWMVLLGGKVNQGLLNHGDLASSCLAITTPSVQRDYMDSAMRVSLLLLLMSLVSLVLMACVNRKEDLARFVVIGGFFLVIWPFLVISFGPNHIENRQEIVEDLYLCQLTAVTTSACIIATLILIYATGNVLSHLKPMLVRRLVNIKQQAQRIVLSCCEGVRRCCYLNVDVNDNAVVQLEHEPAEHVLVAIQPLHRIELSFAHFQKVELTEIAKSHIQQQKICAITRSLLTSFSLLLRINACSHFFSASDLLKWLERSATCPQCRGNVNDAAALTLFKQADAQQRGSGAAISAKLDGSVLQSGS